MNSANPAVGHSLAKSEGGVAKRARHLLAKQIIGSAILPAASSIAGRHSFVSAPTLWLADDMFIPHHFVSQAASFFIPSMCNLKAARSADVACHLI